MEHIKLTHKINVVDRITSCCNVLVSIRQLYIGTYLVIQTENEIKLSLKLWKTRTGQTENSPKRVAYLY
jgi:hypothetical protein